MNIGMMYGQSFAEPGMGGSVHGYQLASNLQALGHRIVTWYYGHGEGMADGHYRGRELLKFIGDIDVLYLRQDWRARSIGNWVYRLSMRSVPVVWELNGLPEEIIYLGGTEADIKDTTKRLRRKARSVTAAIGVTKRVAQYLKEELGIGNVVCIPNGSDPEMFGGEMCNRGCKEPLRVVWMGSAMYSWHDIEAVVAASKELDEFRSEIEFHLIGKRNEMPKMQSDNVVYHGRVPYKALGKRLADMDVGLCVFRRLPILGRMDGSPLKLFDYMASGMAVVSCDGCQSSGVVTKNECGVVIEEGGLAKALQSLAGDREKCLQYGRNGRMAVEDYYNWRRVALETEEVLHAAIRRDKYAL